MGIQTPPEKSEVAIGVLRITLGEAKGPNGGGNPNCPLFDTFMIKQF